MNKPKILFIGEGHGAHSAFFSLSKEFEDIDIVKGIDNFLDQQVKTDNLQARLSHEGYDLIVTAGYRYKFPSELIEKITIINIHYALLPRFRGLHSLVWAMLNKEEKIGLSVHIVNNEFDAGPILYQYAVENKEQTSWEFMDIFDKHIKNNLGSIVRDFWCGKIKPVEQDSDKAIWCCRRNITDCKINFDSTCDDLKVFFRALVKPYPLPHIVVKGILYEIIQYELKKRTYYVPTGRVVNVDNEGTWVKVLDGFLIIKKLANNGVVIDSKEILKLGTRL